MLGAGRPAEGASMKKQTKMIIAVSGIMAVLLVVLIMLNMEHIREMSEYQKNALVRITVGEEYREYDMDEIKTLAAEDFTVVERSSTAKTVRRTYTGVPLKDLLAYHGVDISAVVQVNVSGADGYMAAILPDELMKNEVVYLTYAVGGRALGNMSEGGVGPYQLVIATDVFAQRWCKYVANIEIKLK